MTKKYRSHRQKGEHGGEGDGKIEDKRKPDHLEVVLKCDFVGSEEAILAALESGRGNAAEVRVIHSGVGPIGKNDLFLALPASRLVAGFNVDVLPGINKMSQDMGIEVRLYEVIYHLVEDLKNTADRLIVGETEERIRGRAKVVALFKSTRRGVILGCEVQEGNLIAGRHFRLISTPGPVYAGKIESLHIEDRAVTEAREGQQVGLKISDFKRAKVGDLVECYEMVRPTGPGPWKARGGVFRL